MLTTQNYKLKQYKMGCFTSPIQDDQKPLWVMNEPDKPKFSLSD